MRQCLSCSPKRGRNSMSFPCTQISRGWFLPVALVLSLTLVIETQCQLDSDSFLDTSLFDYGVSSGEDYPVSFLSLEDTAEAEEKKRKFAAEEKKEERSKRNLSGGVNPKGATPNNPWMSMLRNFLAKPSGKIFLERYIFATECSIFFNILILSIRAKP